MIFIDEKTFRNVHDMLHIKMRRALPVKTERWQGIVANTDTRELRNVAFEIDLGGNESLEHWATEIKPNLPWADDHFAERVGGEPLNPGVQWANWPWGQSANKFRTQDRFNHTYQERMWPKYARRTSDGKLSVKRPGTIRHYPDGDLRPHYGIAGYYGDLEDWVELLAKEPYTRQAWMPLFHPEDTGIGDGGRKVCSLGYQIIVRENRAHIWYPLRSCDLIRHWTDDCYLAVRMLLWVIGECRRINPDAWKEITPGTYSMHTTSLHIFETDLEKLI